MTETKTEILHGVCICRDDYIGLCGEKAAKWPKRIGDDVAFMNCPECERIDAEGKPCQTCAQLTRRRRLVLTLKSFWVDVVSEVWVRVP